MSEGKTLHDRVEAALDLIRPVLVRDGGNVDLISVNDDGVVEVKLVGACHGCPAAAMTLKAGIEATLKEQVPEVTNVVSV
ncbi:MAG: NifU family protein [bacterium]|nr:NifU family protein [bacterium]